MSHDWRERMSQTRDQDPSRSDPSRSADQILVPVFTVGNQITVTGHDQFITK